MSEPCRNRRWLKVLKANRVSKAGLKCVVKGRSTSMFCSSNKEGLFVNLRPHCSKRITLLFQSSLLEIPHPAAKKLNKLYEWTFSISSVRCYRTILLVLPHYLDADPQYKPGLSSWTSYLDCTGAFYCTAPQGVVRCPHFTSNGRGLTLEFSWIVLHKHIILVSIKDIKT